MVTKETETLIVHCDGCGRSATSAEVWQNIGKSANWLFYCGADGYTKHYCPECRGEV